MTSAFLCGHTGIEPATIENAAAYVAGWLKVIRQDARLVVTAAAQAQKAADYILGRTWSNGADDAEGGAR
jgi:antirestriction protein ArdC